MTDAEQAQAVLDGLRDPRLGDRVQVTLSMSTNATPGIGQIGKVVGIHRGMGGPMWTVEFEFGIGSRTNYYRDELKFID